METRSYIYERRYTWYSWGNEQYIYIVLKRGECWSKMHIQWENHWDTCMYEYIKLTETSIEIYSEEAARLKNCKMENLKFNEQHGFHTAHGDFARWFSTTYYITKANQ